MIDKPESNSGLGEFWGDMIEENEQEKRKIQELIEKRKREALHKKEKGEN